MNKIEELKEAEKAYQIAEDWYYGEKITGDEYKNRIGKYYKMNPNEIIFYI